MLLSINVYVGVNVHKSCFWVNEVTSCGTNAQGGPAHPLGGAPEDEADIRSVNRSRGAALEP